MYQILGGEGAVGRQRPLQRLGHVGLKFFNQKFSIDRVRDGPANAHVVERRLAQIEFEIIDDAEAGECVG